MTPEKAKQICPDFFPIREGGKIKCKFKSDDLCMHPGHFVCELVSYKKRLEHKQEHDLPALSPSRIKTMEECARKYALIYEHHSFVDQEATWKIVGNAFTVGRAKIDMNMPWSVPDKEPRYDMAKVRAALRYYQENPPYPVGSVVCETEVYLSRENWWFLGYLDAITIDFKTIREWKYAVSKFSLVEVVRQAAVYFLGYDDATSFELWRFPKPMERPRNNETPEQFEWRIFSALSKKTPKEVYQVMSVPRSQIPVKTVLNQMVSRMKILPVLQERGSPPSYGRFCGDCEYNSSCEKGLGKTTAEIAGMIKAAQFEDRTQSNEVTG